MSENNLPKHLKISKNSLKKNKEITSDYSEYTFSHTITSHVSFYLIPITALLCSISPLTVMFTLICKKKKHNFHRLTLSTL